MKSLNRRYRCTGAVIFCVDQKAAASRAQRAQSDRVAKTTRKREDEWNLVACGISPARRGCTATFSFSGTSVPPSRNTTAHCSSWMIPSPPDLRFDGVPQVRVCASSARIAFLTGQFYSPIFLLYSKGIASAARNSGMIWSLSDTYQTMSFSCPVVVSGGGGST
jgi:hypothetical protein